MVTPVVDDIMDNVRSNCSLLSTSLSHTKLIKAVARLLPGSNDAKACLEKKSTPPPVLNIVGDWIDICDTVESSTSS